MASRRALVLGAIALAVLLCADMVDATKKKKKWKPCASGKTKDYVRCCRKRACNGSWDPSCPKRGRSCAYVPGRYFWKCCKGRSYWDIYDPACDDAYWWGPSCSKRKDKDACCAAKNPWTDRRACQAWTTGTCRKVSRRWQKACCAGKWPGEDRFCDRDIHIPGWSCASWGPDGLDACCASKDPWTDKQACKAWLPWGDCRKVKKSYRPACCDNKPWDAPGCYTPPRPGASCASRPPKDQDKCCATLWNVRTDPQGCPAWQPRNGGCESVSWRYRDQCCFNKDWGVDWWCDNIYRGWGMSPAQLISSSDPIADGTGTGGSGSDVSACKQADYTCVGAGSFCLGKQVMDCAPGTVCNQKAGADALCGFPKARAGAAFSISESQDPVEPAQPPACEGSNSCLSDTTYCFNSTDIMTCADGFKCTGAAATADTPCTRDTAAAPPECTQPDNTCINATALCVGQTAQFCDAGSACTGDQGQATCEASAQAAAAEAPPVVACDAADFTCTDGTTYCESKELVACPAGYKCTGGADPCTLSADVPVACQAGITACVDGSNLCDDGVTTACGEGETCVALDGQASCRAPPEPTPEDSKCDPVSSCISETTLCGADGTLVNCDAAQACLGDAGAGACGVLPPPLLPACTPSSCVDNNTLCNDEGAEVPCDAGATCTPDDNDVATCITPAEASGEVPATDAPSPSSSEGDSANPGLPGGNTDVPAPAPTPSQGETANAPTPSEGQTATPPTPSEGQTASAPTPTEGQTASAPAPTIGDIVAAPTPSAVADDVTAQTPAPAPIAAACPANTCLSVTTLCNGTSVEVACAPGEACATSLDGLEALCAPTCTQTNNTCVNNTQICIGSTQLSCGLDNVCAGAEGLAECVPQCTQANSTCIDLTSLCRDGVPVACGEAEECQGEQGAAACAAPPPPTDGTTGSTDTQTPLADTTVNPPVDQPPVDQPTQDSANPAAADSAAGGARTDTLSEQYP